MTWANIFRNTRHHMWGLKSARLWYHVLDDGVLWTRLPWLRHHAWLNSSNIFFHHLKHVILQNQESSAVSDNADKGCLAHVIQQGNVSSYCSKTSCDRNMSSRIKVCYLSKLITTHNIWSQSLWDLITLSTKSFKDVEMGYLTFETFSSTIFLLACLSKRTRR